MKTDKYLLDRMRNYPYYSIDSEQEGVLFRKV